MSGMEGRGERFREVQRFRQWWLWVPIAGFVLSSWWVFLTQVAFDRSWVDAGWDWGPWILVVLGGIGLPLVLALVHLVTAVDGQHLCLSFWPLPPRRIALTQIDSAVATTYRPLLDYGGWGARWFPGRGRAYSVQGNRGVQLVLVDGRRIMVGSQRPEELAAAITRRR